MKKNSLYLPNNIFHPYIVILEFLQFAIDLISSNVRLLSRYRFQITLLSK